MTAATKGYGVIDIKFQLWENMKGQDVMDLQISFLAATPTGPAVKPYSFDHDLSPTG
jgi:hypothetical protein